MTLLEVLNEDEIKMIISGLSAGEYEIRQKMEIETIQGENYWHGERMDLEQVDELVDYYYITGTEAKNYDEARKFIAAYYMG